MSYLVLARQYRPKTFTEMVGQSHVVQALRNALVSKRLHHAYLFTGTRGVGKTTVSRILAKSLNCETGITDQPCGVCDACVAIDSGRFVDYTELDAASNRSVDEVQALLEQAVYKPVQGRFKVFMIDEVHMLTGHAFNAMLKTLEEPPEYLKFVLATTDPQKVPVTVLSRCLQFNLRPMAPETIMEHLIHVLGQENIQSETQALRLIARAARGSMRDALSLCDQAIAYGNGALKEQTIQEMLGSVDQSHVFDLIDAMAAGDVSTVVQICENLRHMGLSAASTLEELSFVLQRMAVLQAVPSVNDQDNPDPDAQRLQALAQSMAKDETHLLYSMCLNGRNELAWAPDEYSALVMVLLRFFVFKSSDSSTASPALEKKTLKTPEVVTPSETKPITAPVAKQNNVPVAAVVAPSIAPSIQKLPVREMTPPSMFIASELGEFWHDSVLAMSSEKSIQAMTRELAMQIQMQSQTANVWSFSIARESLNTDNHRQRLEEALALQGHAIRLQIDAGVVTDSPALRIQDAQAKKQKQAEDIILEDPSVQQLMQTYGAKIIPGSIKPL